MFSGSACTTLTALLSPVVATVFMQPAGNNCKGQQRKFFSQKPCSYGAPRQTKKFLEGRDGMSVANRSLRPKRSGKKKKDSVKGLPPFVGKLYAMVDDPATDRIISWGPNEETFVVHRPEELSSDLLPQYFKHNNFCSFIRQVNTYGFTKVSPDNWEFVNEYFKKGTLR